jgi:hypothetical protein
MPNRRKKKAMELADSMDIAGLTSFRVANNMGLVEAVLNHSRASVNMTNPVWTACFGPKIVVCQLTDTARNATDLGNIVAWLPEYTKLKTDCHDDSVAKFVKPVEARLLTKFVCLDFSGHTNDDDEMMTAWDFYANAVPRDVLNDLRKCDILGEIGVGDDLPESVKYTPASYEYDV